MGQRVGAVPHPVDGQRRLSNPDQGQDGGPERHRAISCDEHQSTDHGGRRSPSHAPDVAITSVHAERMPLGIRALRRYRITRRPPTDPIRRMAVIGADLGDADIVTPETLRDVALTHRFDINRRAALHKLAGLLLHAACGRGR